MSKSLLARIIESSWFQSEVSSLISGQIMGRDCMCYPDGAATAGTIVDYELTGPLVFGPPDGEGLQFRVGFESRGVASGSCKTSEGADYTYSRDSRILGRVMLDLGPDAVVTENLEHVVEGTLIEVTITEVQPDDESPTQAPPEKFAGES